MGYECFEVENSDHIAHLQLSRGDAFNTMTHAFWAELPAIVREIDRTGDARAMVLSSSGRHFCAGMDLSVFASMPDMSAHETGRARAAFMQTVRKLQESLTTLEEARVPVIAAIQGGCLGGGIDMISACDMRYCTADAFFCIQEINLGIVADVGTYPRLAHIIPQGVLRELAFTGRRLDAARALDIGLVNAVFDTQEEMMEAVMGTAREIAAKSPLAVWGTKEMLNYGRDHSIADALHHVATWQSGMLQETDLKTALAAKGETAPDDFDNLLPRDSSVL